MNSKKEVYSFLEKFRGGLNPGDTIELFFIGCLIDYLAQDARYSKVVKINSLLEVDEEISLGLQKTLREIEEKIPYFKDVFSHLNALNSVSVNQFSELLYVIKALNLENIGYDAWCRYLIDFIDKNK